jgi:hypothetical protein
MGFKENIGPVYVLCENYIFFKDPFEQLFKESHVDSVRLFIKPWPKSIGVYEFHGV